MHIKALKVFCDIVSRRSFSRAADENGISQSGASQIVHQLEHRLGVRLIDRSKRPFVLTPEGQTYYDGCRQLVQRYDALEEEVRTPPNEIAGRVRVASIYSVGLSHMNRSAQEFLSKFPKANVRLEYQHPRKVYDLVKADQVDVGLVSYPRSSRHITATAWREEPMVLVCAPSHPLAAHSSLDLSELNGQRVVSYDADLPIRREIDRVLATHGVEMKVAMEFDNIETIKGAIEIDAGVGFVPEPTVTRELEEGTLVAVPLEGRPLVRPLGIIRRRGRELGRTARRFLQMLLEKGRASDANADSAVETLPETAAESKPTVVTAP